MLALLTHPRSASRLPVDALLDPSPEPITPAMRAVAIAADAWEAFPFHHDDDEAAEYAHRAAGAGFVEAMLARD